MGKDLFIVHRYLQLLLLLPFTNGCAYIDVHVSPPSKSVFAAMPNFGRGREVVLHESFADRRAFANRCGMQKNGYNIESSTVYCNVPPPEWMSTALKQGLVSANFRVLQEGQNAGPDAVHIQGAVFQFFVEPDIGFVITPEADIGVSLMVTSPSGLRAERVFYVKGEDWAMIATDNNYQNAYEDATSQIVRKMVEALGNLMDRYPQLGKTVEMQAAPNRQ